MNEHEQRETARTELQYHREEAQRHADLAKAELELADYHLRQVNTWGQYLSNIGRVTLQLVPEVRDQAG